MKHSLKAMMLSAAVTGLLGATPVVLHAAPISPNATVNASGLAMLGAFAHGKKSTMGKHSCKGKNDCKGQGGCKSSDNGCKGKNSCKGKGGCNTIHPM